MKKTILSAVAICLFSATAALAQTTPVKVEDGGDKTKQTVDGMEIKTKVDPKDGKMKVKGKDNQGNSMKAYTKPRKGDMKMDKEAMKAEKKEMKMEKKDAKLVPTAPAQGM